MAIENGFRSENPLVKSTIAKSFKFAASKETNPIQL